MKHRVAHVRGGYYIAAQALPCADGSGFVGHFKIFTRRVDSYLDESFCVGQGTTEWPFTDERRALHAAFERVQAELAGLRRAALHW